MENNQESGGGGGDKQVVVGGGDRETEIFKCSECHSIFKRRDHLGRHMMTQHDEQSHRTKCPLKDCDTEMVRRDHLRRHISQVHKVDPSEVLPYSRRKPTKRGGAAQQTFDPTKRFKCVYSGCDAELSRKDHLCRHIKNIHKADPREVIGHMYKTPRPLSSSSPGGTGPSQRTSSLASPPNGKTKKKSKKKKEGGGGGGGAGSGGAAEDSANPVSDGNSHHHSHPPPPHPHPSTLSDYDYGADYSNYR